MNTHTRFHLLPATERMLLPSGKRSTTRRQVAVMERGSIVRVFNTRAEAAAWCESREARP